MARYRVSDRAARDIGRILAISRKRWGEGGRQRYAALIVAAMRTAAENPEGHATRSEERVAPGIRSVHLRHVRGPRGTLVRRPVHILYFRVSARDVIDIVRVLHERMDASRRLKGTPT